MDEPEQLLMIGEVADRLHLSPVAVAHLLRAGTLPGVKVDRLWRVREADLAVYSNSLKPAPAPRDEGGPGAR